MNEPTTWDAVVQGFEQVWADTQTGWKYIANNGMEGLKDAILDSPEDFEPSVEHFLGWLTETQQILAYMGSLQALVPADDPSHDWMAGLHQRYQEIAAGFFKDTRPADQVGIGFAPVLIVMGLAIGVSGTAWAVTAYEYAENLRDQTALASKELEARIEASKAGTVLQETTLPASASPGRTTHEAYGKEMMWWSLGGMAVFGLLTWGIFKTNP